MNLNNINDLWGQYNSYLSCLNECDRLINLFNNLVPFSTLITEDEYNNVINVLSTLRMNFDNILQNDIQRIQHYYRNH